MKSQSRRRIVSLLLLILLSTLMFDATLYGQRKRVLKPDRRGLKVSPAAEPGAIKQAASDAAPAAAADKPQLVVQLGHGSSVSYVAFSPDGRSLLTASSSFDDNVILWDVATGAELRRFVGHSEGIRALAFSPDGRFVLTGGFDKTARLWDAATGAELRRFKGAMGPVLSVAFSADGRQALAGTTSHYEQGRKASEEMVWVWDIATGKPLHSFAAHLPIEFSRDGRFALMGSEDNAVRLMDVATGQQLKHFVGHSSPIARVAFSPDGRFILTSSGTHHGEAKSEDRSTRLWEIATAKEVRRFDNMSGPLVVSPDGSAAAAMAEGEEYTALVVDLATGEQRARLKGALWPLGFSPDGRFILTADANNIRFWDAESRRPVRLLNGQAAGILSASFSRDGRYILTGSDARTAQLWDAATGRQIQRYDCGAGSVGYAALSPDARYVFTQGFSNEGRLWNAATGEEIRRIYGRLKMTEAVALSPDGRYVFTGGFENPARLWDAATGNEVRRFVGYPGSVDHVAFSPDSRFVLTLSYDKRPWRWACLWNAETGRELRRFKVPLHMGMAVVFSPDSRFLLVGGTPSQHGRNANLFDLITGNHIRSFVGHTETVGAAAFSPDGRYVLTGSWDGTARLWNAATGGQVRAFKGHSSGVWSVAFSADGRYVLTGSTDSTTRLWRVDTGAEICRLISFKNGDWVAIDPEGRFDTNNLDEIKGLHWVMPDDPFKPLPAEIFMRDYYEPRLLSRILAGERFKPVRSLSDLNCVQPGVAIKSILYHQNSLDTVVIEVEVSNRSGEFLRGGKKVELKTGAYDLRLFRDGQLVGYEPKAGGEITTDPATGKQVVTFRNIKLPRKQGVTEAEFSAYAFNVDGVKSSSDRKRIELAKELAPLKGRAYVITIGVNAYEDADFDLSFAANDARIVQSVVSSKLAQLAAFDDIVQIPLISDYEMRGGQRVVTETSATKGMLKALLEIMAGKYVDADIKKRIPNADKIRRVRPEDLVLISFSSHGFSDDSGNFYFVPYDTGQVEEQKITAEFVKRCISSEELSVWLRDVDAGEMVMIVDACHSAATIAVEGFKPGPMGSRGLGQLAYDKGMRILTSTQADDVALESELIKQGLLTYALTQDGIEAAQADFKPKDQSITLAEWLEYGVKRVPSLYEEVKKGEIQSFGRGKQTRALVVSSSKDKSEPPKSNAYQQPALFDFARRKQEVVLVKVR